MEPHLPISATIPVKFACSSSLSLRAFQSSRMGLKVIFFILWNVFVIPLLFLSSRPLDTQNLKNQAIYKNTNKGTLLTAQIVRGKSVFVLQYEVIEVSVLPNMIHQRLISFFFFLIWKDSLVTSLLVSTSMPSDSLPNLTYHPNELNSVP